jgi:hypothetical protein
VVSLLASYSVRSKDIVRYRADFAKVTEALATLEKKPADADANELAGKYYCLAKGSWDKGLPLLAQAKDTKLKELAEKDAAGPDTAQAQMEMGDAWYELANGKEFDSGYKAHTQLRALFWYEQAVGGLTGLTKTKVEKSVTELDKAVGSRRDFAPLFDAVRATVKGTNGVKTKDTGLVGFGIGTDFRDVPPDGSILIGFEVGTTNNNGMQSLKPIYLTRSGEKAGTLVGKTPEKVTILKAKPGYAVAGVNLHAPLGIHGLSLTYMRIGRAGLMKSQAYASDWVGAKSDNPGGPNGDGAVVVGFFGKKGGGGEPCAIGLVMMPAEKK